jgi:hypothetical protein
MPKSERTFTISGSDIGFAGGNYKASAPGAAGKKAARQLFRLVEKDPKFAKYKSQKTIKFLLRETTRDSAKKSFYYESSMNKLKEPIILERNGVQIKIERQISVFACKDTHPSYSK